MATTVIEAYYAAFNRGDWAGMLALLTEDVAHDINQGERELGREQFAAFLQHMARCYREQLRDLVVMQDPSGTRGSAEFVVHGSYLATDPGFIEATGQSYVLPAGAFFELREGKIVRVTNYYNVKAWLTQVGAAP